MKIVENRKLFFTISAVLLLLSVVSLVLRGFNVGIDFRGGTVLTVEVGEKYDNITFASLLKNAGVQDAIIQNADGNTAIVRFSKFSGNIQDVRSKITSNLEGQYKKLGTPSYETVSPATSRELLLGAFYTLLLAIAGMLIYIWRRFEIKAGIAAIVGIAHDILLTMGIISVLHVQINSTFIAAVLTLLGYSINNTIIIFDRVRENNKKYNINTVTRAQVVNISVKDTAVRTIFSSMTTLITIVALFIFGVASVKEFALPIIIGILSSLYSCICINPSVWEWLVTRKKKVQKTA